MSINRHIGVCKQPGRLHTQTVCLVHDKKPMTHRHSPRMSAVLEWQSKRQCRAWTECCREESRSDMLGRDTEGFVWYLRVNISG